MSENPYKGVPGGDPRLRAANQKRMVTVEFICGTCGQLKKEKLPEGKDATGRTCVDCRNAEGVEKQKAQAEEARRRWAERERITLNTPIRTKAEKLALIAEWKDAPREKCSSCKKSFFIANPAMPFANDNIDRPNAILTVSFTSDPFKHELYGDDEKHWFCRMCHREIAWDV